TPWRRRRWSRRSSRPPSPAGQSYSPATERLRTPSPTASSTRCRTARRSSHARWTSRASWPHSRAVPTPRSSASCGQRPSSGSPPCWRPAPTRESRHGAGRKPPRQPRNCWAGRAEGAGHSRKAGRGFAAPGAGSGEERSPRSGRAPDGPPGSMPRGHQRRDREPVLGDALLLTLVEVPALLPREAMARERRLGGVLELHVDHDDRRLEAHLVLVLDDARPVEGLLPEAPVVDPDLPQLARAVVDVGERHRHRLLVDEDDAL